ncbi:MAG: alpha/beta fold hydrolase [Clostridium sp.]|nr:alpha/beta fold hydrolase [Clostridium sp.]
MNSTVMEKEFECTRDELTIRGVEYRPYGEKIPAIIVSHGFGGNHKHVDEGCKQYALWGYAAYAYDFCGGSAVGEGSSDGNPLDMTIDTECRDLMAVISYVCLLPYIDPERITLLGYSQGGLVSALIAARQQGKIKIENLILCSPALCIPDDARAGALAGQSYDVNHVPEVIDCGNKKISKKFHEDVVEMDVFREIAPYKGRVMILHGLDDQIVDYHYAVKASKLYESDKCHLQLVKAAGHCFNSNQKLGALASIHQFLLGKKEVLTIEVNITGSELRKQEGSWRQTAVLFDGSSESKYFKGVILPGAEDVQEYDGEKLLKLRADYTLEGKDYTGAACHIHIVNQDVKGEWKPTVETDSKSLEFLNHADLTAALEGYEGGLTVRIFADVY